MTVSFHHAGVYVRDLERSIRFYGDAFGLHVIERLTLGDEEIAFLDAGAARVELLQSPDAFRRETGVTDHIAFHVTDLDVALDDLARRGVHVIDSTPIQVPELHARIAFCEGPDGERIELFEQR